MIIIHIYWNATWFGALATGKVDGLIASDLYNVLAGRFRLTEVMSA